jgi:glycine cleavage system H protein
MANYPAELKYTKDHEWARRENGGVRVGITEFAVEQLGDIESVKAVSELFAPISGKVVAVNTELADHPELVNDAPYEKGWMLLIAPDDANALDALMDVASYQSLLESLDV